MDSTTNNESGIDLNKIGQPLLWVWTGGQLSGRRRCCCCYYYSCCLPTFISVLDGGEIDATSGWAMSSAPEIFINQSGGGCGDGGRLRWYPVSQSNRRSDGWSVGLSVCLSVRLSGVVVVHWLLLYTLWHLLLFVVARVPTNADAPTIIAPCQSIPRPDSPVDSNLKPAI